MAAVAYPMYNPSVCVCVYVVPAKPASQSARIRALAGEYHYYHHQTSAGRSSKHRTAPYNLSLRTNAVEGTVTVGCCGKRQAVRVDVWSMFDEVDA